MGILDKPEGGDIETYRAYNTPEAAAERETAIVASQIDGQKAAEYAADAARTVRAVDSETKG